MKTRLATKVALALGFILAVPLFGAQIIVNGFSTPESVVHDTQADVYLVSNINGDPRGFNDNHGFISRVSPDGTIVALKWIQGGVNGAVLHAPKGIALRGDVLYVADCDTLRTFDRTTGAPLANIVMPNPFLYFDGSMFLNDVAVSSNGTVFLSDSYYGALFKVDRRGHASVLATFATGSSTEYNGLIGDPNGLLADDEGGVQWVTYAANRIMHMDSKGNISTVGTIPCPDLSSVGLPPNTLFLDGFARGDEDNIFLVSSWTTGAVYRVKQTGEILGIKAKFDGILDNPANPAGPADISTDNRRHRLLITVFSRNQLVIQDLASKGKDN